MKKGYHKGQELIMSELGLSLEELAGQRSYKTDYLYAIRLWKGTNAVFIPSMTTEERLNPNIIGDSRRRRIARGSGVKSQDVNHLLNQFYQMQKLVKMGASGKLPKNLTGIFK